MILTREVRNQRRLSLGSHSFIVFPRPYGRPRRPVGLPFLEVPSWDHSVVLPGETEGRLYVRALIAASDTRYWWAMPRQRLVRLERVPLAFRQR